MANRKRYFWFFVASIGISAYAAASYGTGFGTSGATVKTSGNSVAYRVGIGVREQALAELIATLVVEKLKSSGVDASIPDATGRAQIVVDQHCNNCHSGDPDRLDLTELSLLSDPQKLDVLRQVASGAMPKNAPPLSNESKDILLNFLLVQGGNE